jgi:hypothetical protein
MSSFFGMGKARTSRWTLGLSLPVLVVFFLCGDLRTRTGWDDTYYILQLSSLVEDGDLDLRNDALLSPLPPRQLLTFLTGTTPSGALKNTFSIGPALVWLPAYAAARVTQTPAAGSPIERWSRRELIALQLLSIVLLTGISALLLRLLLREGFDFRLAVLATLTLLLGTPLALYGPALYTMNHLASAAAAALYLAALLLLEREPSPLLALLSGIALGLVVLVRWQDAVFAVLFLGPLLPLAMRREWGRLGRLVACAGVGALVMALLQCEAWHLEFNSWLTLPQGGDYMRWTRPEILRFLVSGHGGLMTWAPVFGVAIAGFLMPWRCASPARWRWLVLFVLAAEIYVDASVRDWWGGHSFGPRRMASAVPLLVFGLSNFATQPFKRLLGPLLVGCTLWGAFVANLYWRQVQDLSLLVRAKSEVTAAATEQDVVSDPGEARHRALRLALGDRHANDFAGVSAIPPVVGSLLTAVSIAVVVFAAAWVLTRADARTVVTVLLVLVLGIGAWFHVRLLRGPPFDATDGSAWLQAASGLSGCPVAASNPTSSERGAQGAPARFLSLFAAWRTGDPRQAAQTLSALAAEHVPAAIELESSLGARRAALLRWIPGSFFSPQRGATSCGIEVPAGPQAAHWRIDFDLLPGDLSAGDSYELATLRGTDGGEVIRLVATSAGVTLVSPGGERGAPFPLLSGRIAHVAIEISARQHTVGLTLNQESRRVTLAAPLGRPSLPAWLVLGRSRRAGSPTLPPLAAQYSELRVEEGS